MLETIIIIPDGKIPYLIPGECNPKLEVYSVSDGGKPNLLFYIPPVDHPVKLNQSDHYRLIFFNEEIDTDWKYSYKIGLQENEVYEILSEISDSGNGQKYFRKDIKFKLGYALNAY